MPEQSATNRTVEVKGTRTYISDLAEQFEKLHDFSIEEVANPTEGHRDEVGKFAVVPYGKELKSLKPFIDEYLDRPRRRTGTARLRDEESFVDHVLRFKSEESAVFANPDRAKPAFLAVLDYHPGSDEVEDTAWLGHRSSYECQLSDEWKAWSAVDGKLMPQADFSAFLEDRIQDVILPPDDVNLLDFARLVAGTFAGPSKLIELSRGLQINVDTVVREIVQRETGEINIKYQETHNDGFGTPIKVPNLFVIAIPVFYAGELYRIPVRLRYRLVSGRIQWSTSLVRPDKVFDDAFNEIRERIETNTKLRVFTGTPEA